MSEVLRLAKNQDRRLRAGHLWIYSNEVDNDATPLKSFAPGQVVDIENAAGRWLGRGYVNPNSLICGRLVTRDAAVAIDVSLFIHRIKVALSMRERMYATPFYRLVFGEADGLPGVVVDRYGDYLALQLSTAGMDAQREGLIAALIEVLKPSGIALRNDSAVRELEGLERYVEVAHGVVPDAVPVEEGGCRFEVSLTAGQKTGWFFDQAANRDQFVRYVAGRRVLDMFSYVGAWSVRAAVSGADQVTAVDVSESALQQTEHNARLNAVDDRLRCLRGDAFQVLRELRTQRERFDVVVLDPPAFIKRKKDMKQGVLAYRRLNEAALGLLARDGILVTASCSFHMHRDQLLLAIQQAARHSDRSLQLLQQGQQSLDHPIHPAIPETAYLKAFFMRVLPTL
ncbi:MAG: class I SAM-dependent rRNA methyltransferase [Chromatiaceae bacterium]|nr:class I SAM-dependent rRNA methyltransferase [Chromatiaceae bacterium]MCP5314758.1 class I SAM-dependent rRNA methyltransferase [Chromatiaceae bacterium]